MLCQDCQHQPPRCFWLLYYLHRIGLVECHQGRYIKGKGPLTQAKLPGTEEVTA